MIQISKERLYEMALDSISKEVDRAYCSFNDSEVNKWLIDSIATIGGITSFTLKVVKEGEVNKDVC